MDSKPAQTLIPPERRALIESHSHNITEESAHEGNTIERRSHGQSRHLERRETALTNSWCWRALHAEFRTQLQSLACNDVYLLLEGFAPRCTNRNIVVAWTHQHGLQIPKRSSIAAIDKYVSFFDMSVEL